MNRQSESMNSAGAAQTTAPRFDYSRIPQEMRQVNNWICWRAEPDPKSHSGIKKLPVNPLTGRNASTNNPETWSSFADAVNAAPRFSGIGFVFAGSGFFGIDIDDMPLDSEEVREIVNAMQTYTERSQSGNGLHLIARGSLPGDDMRRGKIEMYAKNRYFVMTGNQIGEHGIRDCTEAVKPVYEKYARRAQEPAQQPLPVSSEPMPTAGAQLSDDDVIRIASTAANSGKFLALWHGDISQYGNDESRADAALCSMLAFYTKDAAQIDRLFRSSGLYRDKWDEKRGKSTYGAITAAAAIANTANTYQPKRKRGRPPKQEQPAASQIGTQTAAQSSEVRPTLTLDILDEFLKKHNITCRLNDITHKIQYDGIPERYAGEHGQDSAPTVITSMLKAEGIKGSSSQTVCEFLTVIARMHHYNPVRELLDAVKWDGKSRIAALFDIMRLPAEDMLSRNLIYKWLLQCLSLACMNDYREPFGAEGVLVLTGAQGIGKTRFARKLGISPELFKEGLSLDPKDKDSLLKATSCFIAELGELESTLKREISILKAFITDKVDEVRPPYGRSTETNIRRTSYIATCNSSDFLLDTTGNRRFFTIPCEQPFDLDSLEKLDVMQLWAEIYAVVKKSQRNAAKIFRLTAQEQEQLNERNGAHTALIPAQAEIMDILETARQNPEKYKRQFVTVTEFVQWYSDILRRYDARQIGKALDICGIPQKQIRRSGSRSPQRVRELPIPDRHFDSVNYSG